MEAERLDESRHFSVVHGKWTTYKYTQDGKFFGAHKMRVNEATGRIFGEENEIEESKMKEIIEAVKADLDEEIKGAVIEAAKSGIKLPGRVKIGKKESK